MRTSAAAPELDFNEASITAAKAVADAIARNGAFQRSALLWVTEQAYGGSSADGRWSLRGSYDMLELAEVIDLAKADLPSAASDCLAALVELAANCQPTLFAAKSRSSSSNTRHRRRSLTRGAMASTDQTKSFARACANVLFWSRAVGVTSSAVAT